MALTILKSRWIVLLLALGAVQASTAAEPEWSQITKHQKSSRALRKFFVGHQQRKALVSTRATGPRQLEVSPKLDEPRKLLTARVLQFANSIESAEPTTDFQRALKKRGKGKRGRRRKRNGKGGKGGKGKKRRKRGKGGGKAKKGGSSKKGSLSKFCRDLDFGSFYGIISQSSSSKGHGPKGIFGKGKGRRELKEQYHRSLQFGGELCAPNVLEVARMDPNLSIFVDLIEATNLDDVFLCAGPFTVLAPSNAAFNENPELLMSLFNPRNVEAVQELLLYHIVPGLFLSDDLVAGPLETLLGDDIDVSLDPLMFNQAGVTDVDIMACNGIIDVIDDILVPPGSYSRSHFRNFEGAFSQHSHTSCRQPGPSRNLRDSGLSSRWAVSCSISSEEHF